MNASSNAWNRDRTKSARVNGTAHAAIARHAGLPDLAGAAPSSAAVDSVPHRFQQALAQLGELKRALATSQDESNAARQQIDVSNVSRVESLIAFLVGLTEAILSNFPITNPRQ